MPKSKSRTLFYDAGFTWTCGICKHSINNKSDRGINMMKKLHFRANPDCKNKASKCEMKRKIHGAGNTIVGGAYQEAQKQDTLLTVGKIEIKEPDAIINLTVEHKENN
jgi:hypothetical protein